VAQQHVHTERRFVSRGGEKLENALAELPVEVDGRLCLDVGASTGGFTDCLLKRGAARVVAVDVGYGQLDWGLRNDERVEVMERTNARYLEPGDIPFAAELAVVDASFISLTKLLAAVTACMAAEADLLALVKPQFEVGRGKVGKGGVVRSPELRREALVHVAEAARELDLAVRGFASSGLPGPKGNLETFVWCDRSGEGIEDLRAAVSEVDA
jgi:23S rRNA (cytidine1920-2'-O)/16S rRNA (cytidine1409-2'-O)-methyltransferase